ncbi:alpha-(1,3)-fucosyltransferase 7-like [Notolabrus celidotus]|uniref:alpha-(1,3)-fucosyltransferase 7-like n=1 Tax=Notolabrus celidotus TaxID=1203425 RepID=UPI00148F6DCD|nr:alpha-(1,3)-fucosyltransferase 7-like [Notolabrus celidotus]XP_034547064.1 alpha-(1,3)-fucosyltransferase 7-like [Notolabrus celidotus]XP_034547065.1 alpha-(1,3)-fucosyltransferase 7-like [Notolabrus celidotus]XP_034547066.1 alpha-(1,3)-fucosyltransferase 7-like [Notolabrus celidotus]XP_034547068.1 alpha-(1,3)-fucosyltransferase 7-like [Notolabrus celidotus]XP_034547069.1 alpha-(1,3)-fucosyltransferase 7-like [Notolabrus celidotus]
MTPSRSQAFLVLLLLSLLSSSLLYFSVLEQTPSLLGYHQHVPQRNISILLWHWPFGRSFRLRGDKCQTKYNISGCLLSDNTSTFSTADVVVFHHHELSNGRSLLPLHHDRPASQRWVWLSLEPPVNTLNLSQLKGLFNWTMSYRRDADIPVPYGQTLLGGDGHVLKAAPNRSCLLSWVVSRYWPQQARAAVYQSLKKSVPIQVYGRWNRRPLSDRKLLPTISKCFFYLSFENSEATDYISEKLWRNAFQAGVVPVVLGPSRATYEALAPPRSFIHVSDFRSTAELAAYLKRVAADRRAYEEYFQWHRTHRIKTYTDWIERLCQICVQYPSLPPNRVYEDLEDWFHS